MRYKALMLDLDGTTVPNRRDGMPSKKVTDAILKASKVLHVGLASSRPVFLMRDIVDYLNLSGPSIANGGAQVIDFSLKKTYYRQPIESKDILPVYKIAQRFKVSLIADSDYEEIKIIGDTPSEDILGMFISAVDSSTIEKLCKEIDLIPTLSSHITPSWTHDKFNLSISHIRATKQHGIFEVSKILKINTREIIGVGDGGNDLPLLMACGLKVAMGNAAEDIKQIADYIAPSIDEDGVADVIEKFIIKA